MFKLKYKGASYKGAGFSMAFNATKYWNLFHQLSQNRQRLFDGFKKTPTFNFQAIMYSAFSAKTQFVYELLQNADDVKATRAEFILDEDKLIFKHNGNRHFSVSDSNTEDLDLKNGTLGDLNAITGFLAPNKLNNPATIGKFGLGFKAVFQYTDTPEIYDDELSFRLEHFIVPKRLDEHSQRKTGETLFVFPFNREEIPATQAYQEISNKLKSLSCPLLFLQHLKEINFTIGTTAGFYKKETISTSINNGITEEIIHLSESQTNNSQEQNWILYSRGDKISEKYSVGYFVEMEDSKPKKLQPATGYTAFCFFPTMTITHLNFIIHAPFLLNASRDNIKPDEEYNINLIQNLAELAAETLPLLRDKNLIDDDILKIIPIQEFDYGQNISFQSFYDEIKKKFQTEALIPAQGGGCVKSANAYWAEVIKLTEYFFNKQLQEIVNNQNAAWVFTSIKRANNYSPERNYIDEIVPQHLDNNDILKRIGADFIEKQTTAWLNDYFYVWLKDKTGDLKYKKFFLDSNGNAVSTLDSYGKKILFFPSNKFSGYTTVHPDLFNNANTKNILEKIEVREPTWEDEMKKSDFSSKLKNYPVDTIRDFYNWLKSNMSIYNYRYKNFFLDNQGNVVCAFKNDDTPILFLPSTDYPNYSTVRADLLDDTDIYNFFVHTVKIRQPNIGDEIKLKILPQYRNLNSYNVSNFDDSEYFKVIFECYTKEPQIFNSLIRELKDNLWLRCYDMSNNKRKIYSKISSNVYNTNLNPKLNEYLKAAGFGEVVDFNYYLELVGSSNETQLNKFFAKIELATKIKYLECEIDNNTAWQRNLPRKYKWSEFQRWFEYSIEGCEELLNKIVALGNSPDAYEKSKILWEMLVAIDNYKSLEGHLIGVCLYKSDEYTHFNPKLANDLRTKRWIFDRVSQTFESAQNTSVSNIPPEYDTSFRASGVIKFLGIKSDPVLIQFSTQAKDIIDYARKNGLTRQQVIDELKKILKIIYP